MGLPVLDDPPADVGTDIGIITGIGASLPAGLETVLARVADRCTAVDRGEADLAPTIRLLGRHGLVSLGLGAGAATPQGTLADQASVLAALAERCMASAFVGWAHRMTVEYLDLAGGTAAVALGPSLWTGATLGSTAMADAFRDLAGAGTLPLTYRTVAGGAVVIDGQVAWASNLRPGTVIVTTARSAADDDPATARRLVVAVTVGDDGLALRPSGDLLALDATASGSLRFDGVLVDADRVLTDDTTGLLRRARPVFLLLQSAFCLGLARAALDATPAPRGVGVTFAGDLDEAQRRWTDAWSSLLSLAGIAREPDVTSGPGGARAFLQARLDAAHLARDATHLELCLTGGRGYAHASATARRLREAAFLPVQSPTEGQLRWELSRSA